MIRRTMVLQINFAGYTKLKDELKYLLSPNSEDEQTPQCHNAKQKSVYPQIINS
jgi:hypothetical protein